MELIKTVAVYPFVEKEGILKILIQKRDHNTDYYPGYFASFGGRLEPGETFEDAVCREIGEELEIYLKIEDFVYLKTNINPNYYEKVYSLRLSENLEKAIKINEGEGGYFFTKEEIIAQKDKFIPHQYESFIGFLNKN